MALQRVEEVLWNFRFPECIFDSMSEGVKHFLLIRDPMLSAYFPHR